MLYIDPKTLKIQLCSFVISSYLPLHEHTLLLDIQVSLASTLRPLGLLFEHGCVGHLTLRRVQPTRHCLDHGAVCPGDEEGQRAMRQTLRRPDHQRLEEQPPDGYQSSSHELTHL